MRKFLLPFLIVLLAVSAHATHNRAGEIVYRQIGYLSYEITVITYTKESSVAADRDTITVDWGDGIINNFLRTNGPIGTNGVPQGESLGNDIKVNKYIGSHTYAGPLPYYVISVTDPNRISSIDNINEGASVNIPFYLEDTVRIYDPVFVGENSSPLLLYPPIDYANVGDTFFHNPAAFDPDGDSLYFQLIPPKQGVGTPVPNYQDPDEILPGINNKFTLNSSTGEVVWAVPQKKGIFNIAILVTEYRNSIKMGTMLRDMQIIVEDLNNSPPRIAHIEDTCIIAGAPLSKEVIAIDPDINDVVTLSAAGGPFELTESPADFVAVSVNNTATGTFEWQTVCSHIRKYFYQVVFKAEDNFMTSSGPTPLVDLETWIIKVVAPPPQNLQVEAIGNNIELSWDSPYTCGNINKFIGFSVWRREGSNQFSPDTCTPGLQGKGYTKIAENLTTFTYVDEDVVRGKKYCYRVLGEFAEQTDFGFYYNKVESLPSNEACDELKRDVPIITNVSVTKTDTTAGKIFVRWVKPIADASNLDTTQFPGPYAYRLQRAVGFGDANPVFNEVAAFTSSTFGGHNDTTYVDSLLNTATQPYAYKVDFYANTNQLVGSSEIASSVFLSIGSTDRRLNLSWEANVPWTNQQYVVFRFDEVGGIYVPLDTVTEGSYSDTDLINDSLYCYYIESIGEYSGDGLPSPLFNLSQEACARPIDTIAPCPPTVVVTNDCGIINDGESCALGEENLKNRLSWSNQDEECALGIAGYKIYFSSSLDTAYTLIDSIDNPQDTFYVHEAGSSLAGCYKVLAIDSAGNVGELSTAACANSCPCYKLPNVFTPNADGWNDHFTPFMPYRYVAKVDMQVFDRWGTLVFKTDDPNIRWDGRDMNSSQPLKEGVYYYVCKVHEIGLEGVQEVAEPLSGFIHLIRGNGNSN